MKRIKRPKKINRGENAYLTNEHFQDYVRNQLDSIYNKLDEIVDKLNN